MNTAFVFPGQGAQKVGMGKALYDAFPAARAVFEEADDALGERLSDVVFSGPADALTLTATAQPAILTVSVAALRAFEDRCDHKPVLVAGHSLGEYTALVASGALEFADAVRLTRARGTFMQEAVPPGQGAMAAIMKVDAGQVADVCAAIDGVSPANFNSPEQTVISGTAEAVAEASRRLKEAGARVIPLKVSAPFHCPLMQPAADKLAQKLGEVTFGRPVPPLVTNVEAQPNDDPARIRDILTRQVTGSVRWTESVQTMWNAGVSTFVEFGPGTVLSGLISKICPKATTVSVGDPESLDKAVHLLENGVL